MFIEANGMETLLFIYLFFISYSLEFCVKKEEIGKKRILDQFSMDRILFLLWDFMECIRFGNLYVR